MDSSKVEIRDTQIYGKRVVATQPIQSGELIAEFDGDFFVAEKATDQPNDPPLFVRDHTIQCAETSYRLATGVAGYIAHSCEPNSGVQNLWQIVAMRDITTGEEITWDYEMSEDSNWRIFCLCGTKSCRSIIGSYKNLPHKIRNQYGTFVSGWLREKYASSPMSPSATLSNTDLEPSVLISNNQIVIKNYCRQSASLKKSLVDVVKKNGVPCLIDPDNEHTVIMPQQVMQGARKINVAGIVGRLVNYQHPKRVAWHKKINHKIIRQYEKQLDTDYIIQQAKKFADNIRQHRKEIITILLSYETYQVADDEIKRTLDLLDNLRENSEYFAREVGAVTAFLPRNQPLYALACFGLVPAFMSSAVYVRPPLVMKYFFFILVSVLRLEHFFPNVRVSRENRQKFLAERSAVRANKAAGQTEPVTDVVIFTGNGHHADKMRKLFDPNTLFIANGSSLNPVVVTPTADLACAVEAVLDLQLNNQGKDCAAPNSVLVHQDIFVKFIKKLESRVRKIHIGPYRDQKNTIGPVGDMKELARIGQILRAHEKWIDPRTPGVIRTKESIVEPTIILKPLKDGGNYIEQFAPIFFVQQYSEDKDLSLYFENERYYKYAGYITVYGESEYVDSLVNRVFPHVGILHTEATILRNTHLHMPGVERGTREYGGYGREASSFSIHGNLTVKPTLPQREIFEQLVRPVLEEIIPT